MSYLNGDFPEIDLKTDASKVIAVLSALDGVVSDLSASAGLSEGFCHLLRLRASLINGCAYCIVLHTEKAESTGESRKRIALVAAPNRADCFSKFELSALQLIEAATCLKSPLEPINSSLPNDVRAAVTWTAILINAWNRYSIFSAKKLNHD